MFIPTKILVPTDFSKFSYKALEQALDIAKICKAKTLCLHVLDGGTYNADQDFVIPKDVVDQFEDDSLACARERLQNQLDRFPQAKEVEVDTNIREGVPCEEILKEAKEHSIVPLFPVFYPYVYSCYLQENTLNGICRIPFNVISCKGLLFNYHYTILVNKQLFELLAQTFQVAFYIL